MKHLLIILMFIFISCGEDNNIEEPIDFCDNHICRTGCPENSPETYIYYKGEKLLIACIKNCNTALNYQNDNYDIEDYCHLQIKENDGLCSIDVTEGKYCDEFLSVNEE